MVSMMGLTTVLFLVLLDVAYSNASNSTLLASKIDGGEEFDISIKTDYYFLCFLTQYGHIQSIATILTPKIVLTAAHVVQGLNPPNFDDYRINYHKEIKKIDFLSSIQQHEPPYIDDLAFVELKNDFFKLYPDYTRALKVRGPFAFDYVNSSAIAYILGNPMELNHMSRITVRKLRVRIPSQEECKELLGFKLHETQMCAVALNGEESNFLASYGDAGAPLLLGNDLPFPFDGVNGIVGIASSSNEKNLSLPGIYTRVSSFESYIRPLVLPNDHRYEKGIKGNSKGKRNRRICPGMIRESN